MIIKDHLEFKLLKEFLYNIDSRLPVPLSERVNIDEYARKVIDSNGNVIGIIEENKLIAAILFYSNDKIGKKAYITLLGVLMPYEGKGYARKLIEEAEAHSKSVGMKSMHLDTQINNQKALEFYARNGYSVSSIVENRVHMLKEI